MPKTLAAKQILPHDFTDGHEVLRVMLRRRAEDQPAAREVPMRPLERFSWFALCVSVPARRSVPSNDEPCLGRQ